MTLRTSTAVLSLVSLLALASPVPAEQSQSQEEAKLNELRNTVVNLLQALVQRGVLTREQAEEMVKSAQEKAAAEAAAAAQQAQAQAKAEENAVRVPYVPEIVKDEIRKQVADQLAPEVTRQVIAEGRQQGWAVPGALPSWIERVSFSGDMRVRGEADRYPAGNAVDTYPYLNWLAINAAGGISRAGNNAFLNTTINRNYLLARLRLNMDAKLDGGWGVGARISTGTLSNPDSLNQQLGQYGARYTTDIDQAYLRWAGTASSGRQRFTIWGGKFPNPYLYTDLVWMPDVTFEGVATDYRIGLARNPATPYYWFVTLGALPQQNIPNTAGYGPSSNNKWLYAGQTGFDFTNARGSRLRLGVAYYDYNHIVGQQNALFSTDLNYTAPPYVQKGNTMFDISNQQDPTQNLFALAADYRELDLMLSADLAVSGGYKFSFFADYVKNLAYKEAAVSARVGFAVPARVKGYEAQLGFGSRALDHGGAWDAFIGYRYLQRDAVLDAFTDQDYHLGGTDAKGYIIGAEVSLTDRVFARLRYMPFDAIDGPPLAIDVWQMEVQSRF